MWRKCQISGADEHTCIQLRNVAGLCVHSACIAQINLHHSSTRKLPKSTAMRLNMSVFVWSSNHADKTRKLRNMNAEAHSKPLQYVPHTQE